MLTNRQVFFIETSQFSLATCTFAAQQNPTRTLVILSHGFSHSSTMTEHALLFVDMAAKLNAISVDALLFDFQGHGLSTGSFQETSPNQRIKNLHAIVDWAKEKYQHIILLGFSMGGAASIHCAAQRDDIDGLITWNSVPSLSLSAPSGTWYQHKPDPTSAEHHGMPFLTDRPQQDIKDVYPEITCPKLHIQGTNDYPGFEIEFAPIFEAAKEPKTKILIDGGDHPFTRAADREILYTQTAQWVDHLMGHQNRKQQTA